MEQIKSLFSRPSAAAVVALLSVTVFYIFAVVKFGKLMGAASWVNYEQMGPDNRVHGRHIDRRFG